MIKQLNWCVVLVMVSLLPVLTMAQDNSPKMLKLGAWVCDSVQNYDEAVKEEQQGRDLAELQKTLFEQQRCIYMDKQRLENIQMPMVAVKEELDGKAKVVFVVKGRTQYVRYTGWTAMDNVEPFAR